MESNILSLESREIFRRRLLISSRVIALLLIIVLGYWGYNYSIYGKDVATNPCWSCGYYYGKQCKQIYLSPTYSGNNFSIKDYLKTIADDNAIVDPRIKQLVNTKLDLNYSEIVNIVNNISIK